MCKSLLVVLIIMMSFIKTVNAETVDEVGTFDAIGDRIVVVSDTAYSLASSVDCYDINNSKDISCFKLQKPQWVGLIFRAPRSRTSEVVKIKAMSEKAFKESQDND